MEAGAHAGPGRPGWTRRARDRHRAFRDRVRRRPALNQAYRVTIGVLGTLLTLGGIVLLPFPGPGWAVIFLGLGLLATEFVWAQRLLQWTRARVVAWTRWAQRQPGWLKVVMGVSLVAVLVALGYGYVQWKGVPAWLPFVG